MNRYTGGRRSGDRLQLCCGGVWIDIKTILLLEGFQ